MKRKTTLYLVDMFQQFFMTAAIVFAVFGTVMCVVGFTDKAEAEVVLPEETPMPVKVIENVYATFDVPLDYDLQVFIIQTCEELNIDAAVVMSMIFYESSYQADAVGDGGNSLGLMQIQERWNKERMDKLGVNNLLDPYQNVTVGIDLMAELLDKHDGNVEMALIEYNAGAPNAEKYWFSKGEYSNEYSSKVVELAHLLNGGGIDGR